MRQIYLILLVPLFSFTLIKVNRNEAVEFVFCEEKWVFPATVEEALNVHNLSYKPPGYYYKVNGRGVEVVLDYHYNTGDFNDEYQPKKTLYSRELHSYVFRFDERAGVYDSLKNEIEKSYKKKFVLTRGIKDSKFATEKNFEYNFLTINEGLTIGIAVSPQWQNKERKVVVRYMYDLPLGEMGIAMGNNL